MAGNGDASGEIARIQMRLAALDAERTALERELKTREQELICDSGSTAERPCADAPVTNSSPPNEKIALFRRLFAGRPDVFPVRWENRKAGRSGYSPACSNEWAKGICGKPKVKCGECPHQAFIPPIADIIEKHLRGGDGRFGDFIAGVYPLLQDETCFERKDHLDYLQQRFAPFVKNIAVLRGGMSASDRKLANAALRVSDDEERLIIATGRYIGEGFDDARLDTLFLTMPIAWKGTLAQYVGRLHRLHDGKKDVLVVDYVDDTVPVLARMAAKRRAGYRALGYMIE